MDFCSHSFLLLFLLMCLSSFSFQNHPASSQCLVDERLALLQLKDGFSIYHRNRSASKLDSWNPDVDCCSWSGIECDGATGHVIELDLSSSGISGPQVMLSRLTKLVSLDLSWNWELLLEKSDFTTLIKNLPNNLRELKLFGVNISQPGLKWGQVISSALPNLRMLDLSYCHLSGPIDPSLQQLQFLSKLDLSGNNFSTEVPHFLSNFSYLMSLSLRDCGLYGRFPQIFFLLPSLQMLDVSYNPLLTIELPEFPQNSAFKSLILSHTRMSGEVPNSFRNLKYLKELDLANCNFHGPLPSWISNLTLLETLDLSNNNFTGPIPSYYGEKLQRLISLNLRNNSLEGVVLSSLLSHPSLHSLFLASNKLNGFQEKFSNGSSSVLGWIDLSNNKLHGPLPTSISNLTQLEELDLSNNNLSGPIPSSLLSHPSLQILDLGYNKLNEMYDKFSNGSTSLLEVIDLSNNKLHGPVPRVLFQLPMLVELDISFNNFSGIQELQDLFQSLKNLSDHHLLDNSLNFTNSNDNSSYIFSYQIQHLSLRSCNISEFPNILKYLSKLSNLDLSNNKIYGEVPKWTWTLGNGILGYLNLSNNFLESLEGPLHISFLTVLDLHSNNLQGSFPLPSSFSYLDLSNNHFTSTIPAWINLTETSYLFLSNNNFSGHIPLSICNAKYLEVLDLSNNRMSGTIPKCVEELSNSLAIISLQGNSFQGALPLAFTKNCSLRTFNLNGNRIEGPLPQSLANCKSLEVLDLGNNLINDAFPHWLGILSEFRVLILRSNKFHGPIVHLQTNQSMFPMLQIIDLSSNGFTGNLHSEFFQSLKAIRGLHDSQLMSQNQVLRYVFPGMIGSGYYQYTVMVTIKGLNMRLDRILSLFISIDFSNNKFDGEIPETIGDLKFIYGLNFSRNGLSGHIPTSLASLKELESLDLSQNILSGEIPWQLTRLTFLAVLNLSHNLLKGSIPQSNQFLTFSNDSFLGNVGLCGPPLSKKCGSNETPQANAKQTGEIDGKFMWIGFGLGYGIGLGTFFWVLVLSKKVCREYMKWIDKMLEMVFH